MNSRIRSILIIIGVLTLIVIGIIVIPRTLSLYYQTKGGQHVEYVLRFEEGINELVCEQLPPADEDGRNEVEQAIVDLNRSIRFNKVNAQTYYYLGKANCLLGNPSDALENYSLYTELRPDNPLGHIGLGFAYEAICVYEKITNNGYMSELKNNQMIVCDKEYYRTLILHAWQESGLQSDEFLINANSQFDHRSYLDAMHWYSLGYRSGAIQLEELELADAINWSISAALASGSIPSEIASTLPVLEYHDPLQIEIEDMRWLVSYPEWGTEYGDLVHGESFGSDIVGTLFWNGRVISIIQILKPGNYEFVIRGINSSPAPIILMLEDNFHPIGEIRLNRGDDSYQEISFQSFLNDGMHIISLNFINNESVDEVDRNAKLDFIKMIKIPDNE